MNLEKKRINLLNPFQKTPPFFEDYFLRQMIIKNKSRITSLITIILIEKIVGIFSMTLGSNSEAVIWSVSTSEILVSIALSLFLGFFRMAVLDDRPFFVKYFIASTFLLFYMFRLLGIVMSNLSPISPEE